MRIAVLGSGKVGGTLGGKWARAGHEVCFGVRDPQAKGMEGDPELESFDVRYDSVEEAIRDSEVVLFAVPSAATTGIIDAQRHHLRGKILIDATNDFRSDSMSKVDEMVSLGPLTRVYRAFNSLGWEVFDQPEFKGGIADLMFCGPQEGKGFEVVKTLIEDIGLRPMYVGDLDQVAIVDSVVRLWFSLAVERGLGRHIAFRTLGV